MDCCLYAQFAYADTGFKPDQSRKCEKYDEPLSKFPDKDGMKHELRKIRMYI